MPHGLHLSSRERNKRFFSCMWGLSSIILILSKFWLSQSQIQHQSTAVVWWVTRYTCQSHESLHDFFVSEESQFKHQLKSKIPWHQPLLSSLSSLCKTAMLLVAAEIRSNWKMTPALAFLGTLSVEPALIQSASITLVNIIPCFRHHGAQSNLDTSTNRSLVVTSQHINKDIVDGTMYIEKLMAT